MKDARVYEFNNATVTVGYGNLLESQAEVLVISGGIGLNMRGGLPGAVRQLAGESVRTDASKHSAAKLGDVVVTGAGNLQAKYLFQVVTVANRLPAMPHLKCDDDPQIYEYIIGRAIAKCFTLLSAMDLNSIAFPCLGLGKGNMPLETVARIAARTIAHSLGRTNRPIKVELYIQDTYEIYKPFDYMPFFEWFAAYKYLYDRHSDAEQPEVNIPSFADVEVADCAGNSSMRHQVFISYSRKDDEKARGVCDLLNKLGIPYWIDIKGIYSGRNFKEVIVNAISTSEIVLFLSSENSNKSDNVAKEISLADKFNKVIIPVKLDNSPMNPKMEYDLSGIDFVELYSFDEKNTSRLASALLAHITMNGAV